MHEAKNVITLLPTIRWKAKDWEALCNARSLGCCLLAWSSFLWIHLILYTDITREDSILYLGKYEPSTGQINFHNFWKNFFLGVHLRSIQYSWIFVTWIFVTTGPGFRRTWSFHHCNETMAFSEMSQMLLICDMTNKLAGINTRVTVCVLSRLNHGWNRRS